MQEFPSPRYSLILNGTDGSPASWPASLHAVYLAQKLKARLLAVTCVELDHTIGIHRGEVAREQEQEAEAALSKVRQAAGRHSVHVETVVLRGKAGPAIVRAAQERQASLLVIGARKMGRVERVLLGSASTYIAQHSELPVLIVRG